MLSSVAVIIASDGIGTTYTLDLWYPPCLAWLNRNAMKTALLFTHKQTRELAPTARSWRWFAPSAMAHYIWMLLESPHITSGLRQQQHHVLDIVPRRNTTQPISFPLCLVIQSTPPMSAYRLLNKTEPEEGLGLDHVSNWYVVYACQYGGTFAC